MRRLIIFTMLFSYVLCVSGQQTQEKYLVKSKKQRNAARILLGAGAAFLITAVVIPQGELTERGITGGGIYFSDKHKNDGVKAVFVTLGIASAAASIPFFISSKKNRKRSAAIGFKFENTIQTYNRNLVFSSLPALGLKVNL